MTSYLVSRGSAPWFAALGCVSGTLLASPSSSVAQDEHRTAVTAPQKCAAGTTGGITLPPGVCATGFADDIGPARDPRGAPNGGGDVHTRGGGDYGNDKPTAGGFLVAV